MTTRSNDERENARPTDWRGSGALLTLYSEPDLLRGMALRRASLLLPTQRSHSEPLAFGILSLPGVTPYNPLQPILRTGNLCYIA
jgi:hypothetical protein